MERPLLDPQLLQSFVAIVETRFFKKNGITEPRDPITFP